MQQVQRRLAAILAADVVGYSRLMAADESGTLARLKKLRAEVIDPKIAQFHGRIVGSAGDSLLVEFASALSAVQCAVEVQKDLADQNATFPQDMRMAFRMGVNLGDVIPEEGTIHGDGVNVAARLEKLAEPGGVCIGRNVHDQVKGKLACTYADLGEQRFHNIPEPVRVYRVTPSKPVSDASAAVPIKDSLPLPDKPSIAVLPFENMSGDPEQTYFSDGITEDIITELSRFQQLFVIARHSSFQYRDMAADVKRISQKLGVQYVVEGSVRKSGDRIRITAQLIDGQTDSHLWAERYDRNLEDLFALQDEVAKMIASALAVRLEAEDFAKAKRKPPDSMRAYDYWLHGKNCLDRWTPEANIEARRLFERAIEDDPDYARAYAGLAYTYEWGAFYTAWDADAVASHEKAFQFAQKAVALNDADHFPHVTLGWVHHGRGEFEQARQHFEKAMANSPNDADTLMNAAMVWAFHGQFETALLMAQSAMRLNPRPPDWYLCYHAGCYMRAKKYSEAAALFEKVPDALPEVRGFLAALYVLLGRPDDFRRHMEVFLQRYSLHWAGRPSAESFIKVFAHVKQIEDTQEFIDALHTAGLPE